MGVTKGKARENEVRNELAAVVDGELGDLHFGFARDF